MTHRGDLRICFIIIFFLFASSLFSQTKQYPADYFVSPVRFPIILSGNFAELRSGHFHSGIDITTQKEEGKSVYACAEGYISRIKISPYGFGKALYIDHPNGYTTVYAHLKGFNTEIDNWVRSEQYRLEQFDVDLFPPKGLLNVNKGELICFSGNSGSSEGPHLHFEVRDTKTEMPIDPQLFGFPVKDFIRPAITSALIYPEGEGSTINGSNTTLEMEIAGWGPVHRLRKQDTIHIAGSFSLGLGCYDLLNGSRNKNGISRYSVYIDSVLKFDWQAETFSFSETRYVNSFIDYANYYKTGNRFLRTRIDRNNKLSMYRNAGCRGIFDVVPDSLHHIKITINDAGKNESVLRFVVKGEKITTPEKQPVSTRPVFNCLKPNTWSGEGIKIAVPGSALYEDLSFDLSASDQLPYTFSKVYNIHHPEVPLHDYIELSIALDSAVIPMGKKMTLASLRPGKSPNSTGGSAENGIFRARIREFGQYAVMADTINPVIKPLNISDCKDISSQKTIRISISDDFSGIRSYRATLNGSWILMDYDPKNRLLEYSRDEHLLAGENEFILTIEDYCGNTNDFNATLLNIPK